MHRLQVYRIPLHCAQNCAVALPGHKRHRIGAASYWRKPVPSMLSLDWEACALYFVLLGDFYMKGYLCEHLASANTCFEKTCKSSDSLLNQKIIASTSLPKLPLPSLSPFSSNPKITLHSISLRNTRAASIHPSATQAISYINCCMDAMLSRSLPWFEVSSAG